MEWDRIDGPLTLICPERALSKQRGKYIVLDGKQRLLSLKQFSHEETSEEFDRLKLAGLEVRPELNNNSLKDLATMVDMQEDVAAFENHTIRTVIIKNWPNETFLYHVFLRLNTGSVSLSPQELRQALHPGPFVDFIDESSQESPALRKILGNPKPDFRMRDAELLVRYYAFTNFLQDYDGNLKEFLDSTCRNLNESWSSTEGKIRNQLVSFENAHKAISEVFERFAYRKWVGDGFENRFNRAIFDLQMYVFRRPNIRKKLIWKAKAVVDVFKRLCDKDTEFRSSIEQTTKSKQATKTRLSRWCEELRDELDIDIPGPELV